MSPDRNPFSLLPDEILSHILRWRLFQHGIPRVSKRWRRLVYAERTHVHKTWLKAMGKALMPSFLYRAFYRECPLVSWLLCAPNSTCEVVTENLETRFVTMVALLSHDHNISMLLDYNDMIHALKRTHAVPECGISLIRIGTQGKASGSRRRKDKPVHCHHPMCLFFHFCRPIGQYRFLFNWWTLVKLEATMRHNERFFFMIMHWLAIFTHEQRQLTQAALTAFACTK